MLSLGLKSGAYSFGRWVGGLGFRVQGLRLRVEGLGCRGLGFRGFRAEGPGRLRV